MSDPDPDLYQDPPERRKLWCDDCQQYRPHDERFLGVWQCAVCGGEA